MAAHADVVGMTVGAECVVAGELGLSYAALAWSTTSPMGRPDQASIAELERDRAATRRLLRDGLEAVLRGWGGRQVTLTVTGAVPRRRAGRGALRRGADRGIGPSRGPARRRGAPTRTAPCCAAAPQRPHPRAMTLFRGSGATCR